MSRLLMVDLGAVWGGQEIYSRSIMELLTTRGWSITSISSQKAHKQSASEFHSISNRYSDFPATARLINSLLLQHDIVHFNGIRAIYLSQMCSKRRPYIGSKHSPYATATGYDLKSRLALISSWLVFNKLDWLISISNRVQEELPMFVRERSSVVMNGVSDVAPQGIVLHTQKPITICFVGRFFELKGLQRLLEAIRLMQTAGGYPEFRVLLAGSGPLDGPARSFVQMHKLERYVEFLGFLPDPGEVFRQSHICVLPSLHEGLPLSLLEALSAGCALVGHDIPGVADIIEEGKNGLFAPVSAEGLAATLGFLITNPARLDALRCYARSSYEMKWRVERMVDDTEAIYRRFL